jgi:hypothetical protein
MTRLLVQPGEELPFSVLLEELAHVKSVYLCFLLPGASSPRGKPYVFLEFSCYQASNSVVLLYTDIA